GDDLFEISHWEMAELAAVLLAAGGLGGADNAGGIDQDPLLAVGGARPGKGGIDLFLRGHVNCAEDAAKLLRQCLALLGIDVKQGDFRAGGGQAARGGSAEPRGAAG